MYSENSLEQNLKDDEDNIIFLRRQMLISTFGLCSFDKLLFYETETNAFISFTISPTQDPLSIRLDDRL